MKTLKFKCKLLSDIILNQKAATESPNKTLDFIPGNCFLGIVAGELYKKYKKLDDETVMNIFHSGKVRFGDAHPSCENVRGLKIPTVYFYPKLNKLNDGEVYVHHKIKNLDDDGIRKKQLKQCRSGFYVFDNDKAMEVKTETNFAIKSAYDREKRRSKDAKMFGYESLQKGLELFFEVEVEDAKLVDEISKALTGKRRIGRSRSAQYGLVEIEKFDYEEVQSRPLTNDNLVTVYADGRLIFIDEYGLPTFQPSPKDLGINDENAKILWCKSQIRTFQYSPWNFKRQVFDADRCGIEKGSVFVVETKNCPAESQYVGYYKNEGFGKVIYNPQFLESDAEGKINLSFIEMKKDNLVDSLNLDHETPLIKYLKLQQKNVDSDSTIYENVNNWVNTNAKFFIGKEKFASQWGAIRGIAMATNDDSKIKTNITQYVGHGIKSTDWEGKRLKVLEEFLDSYTVGNIREAVINLSSEMAKKCRKEDK